MCLLAAGCASNAERIDAFARASSLERFIVEIDGLNSAVYLKRDVEPNEPLLVFLEGDGNPWRAGLEPNIDPTTADPLALELLVRTPRAGAYVSRPCYQGVGGARCSPVLWTSARYSEDIVRTMVHTIRTLMHRTGAREAILIGHSGGGTLAVLIAERMEAIAAVVTIAANLDTDAWTKHRGYLPLSESLNPARSTREHTWREIHIAGRQDEVVPIETTATYFERYPSAERWLLDEHSHACCWREAWPQLWARIEAALRH
jgi:pimeloyl-ACP methyl ester carboxylesterase